MLGLLHVGGEAGQRGEALLAPHALEHILGGVGALVQPMGLPGTVTTFP